MKELDRNSPMEAVHKLNGKVGSVRTLNQSKALCVGEGIDTWTAYFDKYGQPKDDFCPWAVRNVQSYTDMVMELGGANSVSKSYVETEHPDKYAWNTDTIPIDRALWERVEGLVREIGASTGGSMMPGNWQREARAIVALLPAVEVDEDERLAEIMFDAAYPFVNGKRNIAWDCNEVRQGWIIAAKAARKELVK